MLAIGTLRGVMSEFPTAVGGDVTTGIEYRDRTLTQVRAQRPSTPSYSDAARGRPYRHPLQRLSAGLVDRESNIDQRASPLDLEDD